MTCESYTTYVGGRLSEQFDHPFVSFEATCSFSRAPRCKVSTLDPGGRRAVFNHGGMFCRLLPRRTVARLTVLECMQDLLLYSCLV